MRLNLIHSTILTVGFAASLLPPSMVFAQSHQANTIEEIIVTAQKREENLQETPVSVTPFTSGNLEDRGFTDLMMIADATPNMQFLAGGAATGGSNEALVYLRGIGQSNPSIIFDSGVGIYLDGVYLARSQGGVLDLFDIERIEVLRGPQGTIFGKNTVGGAVNVITRKPTGELGGELQATFGNYDRWDLDALVNFPVIEDTLFAKASFSTRNRDGYVDRVLTGERDNDEDRKTFRGGLLWLPSDSVNAYLTFDYLRERARGNAYNPVTIPGSPLGGIWNALVGIPTGVPFDERWIPSDPHKSNSTGFSVSDADIWSLALTVNWDLGSFDIKSITSYRDTDSTFVSDPDGTPAPISNKSPVEVLQEQFSQEIQVFGLAFDERLNWMVGAYYFTENPTEHVKEDIFSGLFLALEALPGRFGPTPFGGLGNPANVSVDLFTERFLKVESDSYSIFAQGTYDLTDKLSFTAGGRYNVDDKSFTQTQYRRRTGALQYGVTNDKTFESFTPKVSIAYQFTDDHMVFGSVSRGVKVGGFNGTRTTTGTSVPFDEEFVWAYELGLKTQWLEDRLRINGSFFFNEYSGLQLTSSILEPGTGGILVVVQNAGDAEMKGVELEITARPAVGLELTAGIGLLDAEYTDINPTASVPPGASIPDTPEVTLNLAGQYSMPLNNIGGTLVARVDYYYKDEQFFEPSNNPFVYQDTYGTVNARLTYQFANEKMSISAFVTNLTDQDAIANGFFTGGGGQGAATYIEPIMYGVSFSISR